MRRWTGTLAITLLFLTGCDFSGDGDSSSDKNIDQASTGGATPGGLQDIALARELVANGLVPPASAFSVEGMFSEHDLPLEGEPCDKDLCVRGALGWQDDTGWLHLGLSTAIDMDAFERPSQAIVLVVDVSGSMGWSYAEYGEPAQVAYDITAAMINEFDAGDLIGLVPFATQAQVLLDFTSGEEHELLMAAIDRLGAGGSTNMEDGLQLAHRMFRVANPEGLVRRVLLLTDAQPNVGATQPGSFLEIAQQLADDDIGLTVIGTGVGLNPEVMDALVDLEGGNGFSVSSAEKVSAFMDDNWPWLVSPVAYNLELRVQPIAGFEVGQGYGFPGEGGLVAQTVFFSRRRGALLVRLDGGPFDTLSAQLELSYETVEGEETEEVLNLDLAEGSVPDEDGRFFEQYGSQKATALALLVDGMHLAAALYAEEREQSLNVITATVERFRRDIEALVARDRVDEFELQGELAVAENLRELMLMDAPQGTLYGP